MTDPHRRTVAEPALVDALTVDERAVGRAEVLHDESAVVLDGPNAGQRVPLATALDGTPLLIGRGPDAAVRLDDDYVSTRHARIGLSGDTWYVEDLGSTNGTYIGNQRLTQATAIQLGTQVRIGKTTLELGK